MNKIYLIIKEGMKHTRKNHAGMSIAGNKHAVSQCHPKYKGRTACLPKMVYASLSDSRESGAGATGSGARGSKTRKDVRKSAMKLTGCKTDRCIAEKANMPSREMLKYLRPSRPKEWEQKYDTWLSTTDIDAVMKQYEEAYPWYMYLGAVPIDFSAPDPYTEGAVEKKKCLYNSFCHLQLNDLMKKGIKGIGAVFNLDPHFKSGSHWTGLYIDLVRKECNFFDSYAYKPHPLISRLMKSLTLQMPLTLNYNARRFQYSNTECGMYSLYFLIKMIEGVPFKKFVKKAVPDSEMYRLRHILFSS